MPRRGVNCLLVTNCDTVDYRKIKIKIHFISSLLKKVRHKMNMSHRPIHFPNGLQFILKSSFCISILIRISLKNKRLLLLRHLLNTSTWILVNFSEIVIYLKNQNTFWFQRTWTGALVDQHGRTPGLQCTQNLWW